MSLAVYKLVLLPVDGGGRRATSDTRSGPVDPHDDADPQEPKEVTEMLRKLLLVSLVEPLPGSSSAPHPQSRPSAPRWLPLLAVAESSKVCLFLMFPNDVFAIFQSVSMMLYFFIFSS